MEGLSIKKILKVYISIIITTLILLVGCSNENTTKVDSAQTVVEKYFQYKNEKNEDKLLTTLAEHYNAPNVVWGFENLDSIKILNIEEEMDEKFKNGYLSHGRGSINGTSENNVKVYKVKYDVKYKEDGVGTQDSGIYEWWFFLIRKDENSQWLIDDMGV